MKKFVESVFRAIEALIVLFLVSMTVMVFGNVVLRYGFDTGIVFSEEVSRYLFVWVIFLGAIVAMRDQSHMRVDIVVRKLPSFWQRICAIVSAGLMLMACWMLFSGSWAQVRLNWDVKAQVSGLPMPLVYGAMTVAAVGLALVIFSQMVRGELGGMQPDARAHDHG